MDKETREFLDRKFNAIDEKFDTIGEKFDTIDERFDTIGEKFDTFGEKFNTLGEKIEENKRYFGVVAEGLRNEIRQVAEGHQVIRNEIQVLREENEEAHQEILSAIKFSYAELDQRIRVLEGEFHNLKGRMDRLEAGRN